MLRRLLRWALPAILALGCVPLDGPLAPPSDPDGATCQEACSNMDKLKCEIAGPRCVEDCREIDSAEGLAGPVMTIDKGCWASASSCAEAKLCP